MKPRLSALLRDSLVLSGAACAVLGAYLAWRPLGLIVGGLAMAAFGIMWEMDRQRRIERDQQNRRDGI
jgi:hypothetical protein